MDLGKYGTLSDEWIVRFWSKVDSGDPTECWEWNRATGKAGYANVLLPNGVQTSGHRIAFAVSHGGVADELVVDHLCRNPKCCNPNHLEAVPQRVNLDRAPTCPCTANSAKRTCPNGHRYDQLRRGKRECSKCKRRQRRERTLREQAERIGG